MSGMNSPKIVKVDLQTQVIPKKPKRKIQGPSKKYLSPQELSKKFQQDLQDQQFSKQQSAPQLNQLNLVESQVQPYGTNEFSFSEQNRSRVKRISGPGYEIFYPQKPPIIDPIQQKINYIHVGLALKIFELCGKSYENQAIVLEDLELFSKNLLKHLKAKHGGRNEQLMSKKELVLRECLKIVFYRKREVEISELLFYIFDCGIADEILSTLMQIFPKLNQTNMKV